MNSAATIRAYYITSTNKYYNIPFDRVVRGKGSHDGGLREDGEKLQYPFASVPQPFRTFAIVVIHLDIKLSRHIEVENFSAPGENNNKTVLLAHIRV